MADKAISMFIDLRKWEEAKLFAASSASSGGSVDARELTRRQAEWAEEARRPLFFQKNYRIKRTSANKYSSSRCTCTPSSRALLVEMRSGEPTLTLSETRLVRILLRNSAKTLKRCRSGDTHFPDTQGILRWHNRTNKTSWAPTASWGFVEDLCYTYYETNEFYNN